MTWHAIYETTTGRLLSVGQVVADPLPAGLTDAVLAGRPANSEMWDEASRSFVPIPPPPPPVDRLQDLLSDPDYADYQTIWNALSAQRKTLLQNVLIRLLGSQRFRDATDPVTL